MLDTHVLVWAAGRDRKLGKRARRLIDAAWEKGEAAVSALSFWEIGKLVEKGRLDLDMPVDVWRDQLAQAGLTELPLGGEAAVRALWLVGLPDDPVDRFIVATTIVHRAGLLTADERVLAWKHPCVRHDARE